MLRNTCEIFLKAKDVEQFYKYMMFKIAINKKGFQFPESLVFI